MCVVVLMPTFAGPDAMPKNREEWKGIMRFWGEVLVKAEGWRGGGEVFEVIR